jgi:RNA polymerase sigma-70 factor (ECF subfamily)
MNNTADRFWKMLKPIHPKAEAFCRKLAGDREEGDDLYQDALLSALQKFASLRDPEAFRPWLYRIIVNRFKNRQRRPWWRMLAPLTPETADAVVDDRSIDPDRRRLLARALEALPPEDRALIVLFEIEGWSIVELARLKGKPEGTIKARLSRARAKMRHTLLGHLPKSRTADSTSEGKYALQKGHTAAE